MSQTERRVSFTDMPRVPTQGSMVKPTVPTSPALRPAVPYSGTASRVSQQTAEQSTTQSIMQAVESASGIQTDVEERQRVVIPSMVTVGGETHTPVQSPIITPSISQAPQISVSSSPVSSQPIQPVRISYNREAGSMVVTPRFSNLVLSDDVSKGIVDFLVEVEIKKKGYTILSKVFVKDSDGDIESLFIKAYDALGHVVFIDLDKAGSVKCELEIDQILIPSREEFGFDITSMLGGVLEETIRYSSGVAMICNAGICTLTHDIRTLGQYKSSAYLHSSNTSICEANLQRREFYPIVKLSDIISDNETVVRNTDAAVKKMENIAYERFVSSSNEMIGELWTLQETVSKVATNIEQTLRGISETIGALESYATGQASSPVSDEKQVIYNLKLRHELFSLLTGAANKTLGNREAIVQLNRDLNILNEFTETSKERAKYFQELP